MNSLHLCFGTFFSDLLDHSFPLRLNTKTSRTPTSLISTAFGPFWRRADAWHLRAIIRSPSSTFLQRIHVVIPIVPSPHIIWNWISAPSCRRSLVIFKLHVFSPINYPCRYWRTCVVQVCYFTAFTSCISTLRFVVDEIDDFLRSFVQLSCSTSCRLWTIISFLEYQTSFCAHVLLPIKIVFVANFPSNCSTSCSADVRRSFSNSVFVTLIVHTVK